MLNDVLPGLKIDLFNRTEHVNKPRLLMSAVINSQRVRFDLGDGGVFRSSRLTDNLVL